MASVKLKLSTGYPPQDMYPVDNVCLSCGQQWSTGYVSHRINQIHVFSTGYVTDNPQDVISSPQDIVSSPTGYPPQDTCTPQDNTRMDTRTGHKLISTGCTHRSGASPQDLESPLWTKNFILWTTWYMSCGEHTKCILWSVSCGIPENYILWATRMLSTGYIE